MKQIKILGVLAIALTLGLSSCNKGADQGGGDAAASEQGGGQEEHVHTFEEAWSSNASKHWHKATCGHNVKGDEANHVWGDPTDVVPATCTENGSQNLTCTICGYVKKETLTKLGHDAAPGADSDAWVPVDSPDCTNPGHKKYLCSKCNEYVVVEIDALGHNFKVDADGNEVIEWDTEPSCEAAGVGGHRTCLRCGAEVAVSGSEAAALGHEFQKDEKGNIVFTWSVEPGCDNVGIGTKHCTRCGQDIAATEEESAALGHDIEAVGGETAPTDGTAAVRLYHCKRCDQTYMGFLANEVTNESKEHVYFEPETVTEGQEQGARFKGRPIGNALALDAQGTSVRQENGECVYCSTETGDFIEYAFRLNAEQAATLQTCRLYCDAKAADYLNGTDFWAYGRSNDEWTPGFYIDGGDERFEKDADGNFVMTEDHEKAGFDSQAGAVKKDADGNTVMVKQGKRIEDYRYVLYVDDQVVDFDPDTANPTHGNNTNMQREEFVLPYTFHLHEGLNKIKFVMAGGYRSLFYKCIFRPYVAPTPVVVNETALEVREGKTAQITSSMPDLVYKSSDASICTVDNTGLVTGVKAGTATITVSKAGNYKDAKVAVTVLEKEGIVTLNLADGVIAPEGGFEAYHSSSSGDWLRNPQKDATLTYTFQSELAGKFDIQLGLRASSDIVLADNISIKVNGADVAVSGTVPNTNYNARDFVVGQADLVVGENTMVITALESSQLYLKTLKFAPHQYVAFQTWTVEQLYETKTGTGWGDIIDFKGEKAFKFNKVGGVTGSFTAEAAGKAMLQLKIGVKFSNKDKTGFWAQSGEAEVKTRITVNGTVITPNAEPSFAKVTDSGVSDGGNISIPEWFNIIEIDLVAGENTITVEYVAGGYSYYLGGIALAK